MPDADRAATDADRRERASSQATSNDAPRQPYAGAVEVHRRTREGTPLELFFAPAPLPKHEPLLIFQHIRKTGGTSLKRVISHNLPEARHLFLDLPRSDRPRTPLADWYRDLLESLTSRERASLVCVASHSANYLISLVDRPVRALTLVREPIDRALSRHYFFGKERKSIQEYYAEAFEGGSRDSGFFNGQSRSLLEPHFDMTEFPPTFGPPPDADLWRARLFSILSEYYMVGVQERFEDSVRRFAHELDWNHVFAPSAKANERRPRDVELDRNTYELIRAANWLDLELHEHFRVLPSMPDTNRKDASGRKPKKRRSPEAEDREADDRAQRLYGRGYRVEEKPSARETLRSLRESVDRVAGAADAEHIAVRAGFAVLEQRVARIEQLLSRLASGAPPSAPSPSAGTKAAKPAETAAPKRAKGKRARAASKGPISRPGGRAKARSKGRRRRGRVGESPAAGRQAAPAEEAAESGSAGDAPEDAGPRPPAAGPPG